MAGKAAKPIDAEYTDLGPKAKAPAPSKAAPKKAGATPSTGTPTKKASAPTRIAQEAPENPDDWQNRIVGHDFIYPDPNEFLFNPMNWRIHPKAQQDAIEGSLKTIGWVRPVLVNVRTQHLIDGHERVKRAQANHQKVAVDYVDLSLEEEEAVLAYLDAMGDMATPDDKQLTALLNSVRESQLKIDPRLSEMLEEMRERHLPITILPPQPTDAAFTDNQYPVPEGYDPKTGEPTDGQSTRMRTVQLYMSVSTYEALTPELRVVADFFSTDNITDTFVEMTHYLHRYVTSQPDYVQEAYDERDINDLMGGDEGEEAEE